jgi:hypothetical protein
LRGLALLALALAACDRGPTCEQAAERAMTLIHRELTPEDQQAFWQQRDAIRRTMVGDCQSKKYDAARITCYVRAQSRADLEACELAHGR